MGWLSKLAGLTEHLRLEIPMAFNIRTGQGIAALRWIGTSPVPRLSEAQCKIALMALLYARTLVNHHETRDELFARVAQAAARVRDGEGDLTFEPWVLDIAGKYLFIWPWHIVEPEAITEAKTYVATLQSASSGALSIQLKMAMGQERILAPSSG